VIGLVGAWLTFTGLVGLTRRLGLQNPAVIGALVAYGLAAAMISLAAIVDGLVATRLAEAYTTADSNTQRTALQGLIRFCYDLASSLTRYYVTAASIAVLLWSWMAWRVRFDRVLPWLGLAISALTLGAQMHGALRMNVHDVMVLAIGQGVWMIWAGVALWRHALESRA
jgi:hypothetical protein